MYSCKKSECDNCVTCRKIHIRAIVQPYAFTFAIFNSVTHCLQLVSIYQSRMEGRLVWSIPVFQFVSGSLPLRNAPLQQYLFRHQPSSRGRSCWNYFSCCLRCHLRYGPPDPRLPVSFAISRLRGCRNERIPMKPPWVSKEDRRTFQTLPGSGLEMKKGFRQGESERFESDLCSEPSRVGHGRRLRVSDTTESELQ